MIGRAVLAVVFASPVPYLLKELACRFGDKRVRVFHNDHREKVELPNGRVINKVASTGWQIV